MKIHPNHSHKNKKRDQCTVSGALVLILRISKWFGLAPLNFVNDRESFKISLNDMTFYRYFLLIFLNSTVFTGLIFDMMTESAKSLRLDTSMSGFVWFVEVIVMALVSAIGVITAPSRMTQMIQYLNHINKIHETLNNGRKYLPKENMKCAGVIFVLFGCIFVFVYEINLFMKESKIENKDLRVACLYIMYYVEAFISMLLELQFVLTALTVHVQLKHLNKNLINLSNNTDSASTPFLFEFGTISKMRLDAVPVKSINLFTDCILFTDKMNFIGSLPSIQSKIASTTLRRLILAYTALCDVVRQIDMANRVITLMLLFSFLTHMVMTPYYIIIDFLGDDKDYFKTVLQVAWLILHTFEVLLIVEPGHKTINEMKRTQALVGDLMMHVDLGEPVPDELVLFQQQIVVNSARYEPLGVCVLDRPLVVSLLGTVTTYLVIILQFQIANT